MSDEKLTAMLELIVPQIIQLIMDNRRLSNKEAADLLYNSELYEMIEKEKSKLWHLSAPTLYSLLDEEITTGKITYPEEV
jgi:hypothetical protein